MNYLIDGHNLIARTPGLSLADPDDEAKLAQLLRRWALADPRRRVTVIFDAGLPGGESHHLSGGGVKAIFASEGRSADDLLIRRIEQIKNPAEFVVVSSDRAVTAAAQRRRVAVQRAEAFAAAMMADRTFADKPKPPPERPDAPAMSADEMREWLALFGPEPETKPRPAPKPAPPPPATPARKSKKEQDDDDLDEWLRLFGYKQ